MRKRTFGLLLQLFKGDDAVKDFPEKDMNFIAAHIEKAMSDAFGVGTADYKAKYRTLKTNLNLNKTLKAELLNGFLSASRLVKMTDNELLSSEAKEKIKTDNKDLIDQNRQDWLDDHREEIMKAVGINIEGGMFKCGRCGSSKTTHYQKQTRSADEPMTVFIQCTKCPNRWRQ
mmetsp:Transcript_14275/g.45749  ORF Transcript_14275/g.45749 Transcript_14275/m.45749 type:complete len:173 (-) Transcript_14275:432-950(-)